MDEAPNNKYNINTNRFDRWLSILSTVASFATAIGVFAGIYFGYKQIAQQQVILTNQISAQREERMNQWQQKFYDNQIDVYRDVSSIAAKISTLKNNNAGHEEIQKAYVEFLTYFWGPMAIFEDSAVEQAMLKFKSGIDKDKSGKVLEQLSLKLSHIFRNGTHQYYFKPPAPASSLGSNEKLLNDMNKLLESQSEERLIE